jgi:hypothetical protein
MMFRRLYAWGLPLLVFLAAAPTSESAAYPVGATAALEWPPPALVAPVTITVDPQPASRLIRLDDRQDYIIRLPGEPVNRGLAIQGGHNVVLVGGEIRIPWQGDHASVTSRTGLKIIGATGVVHVEGLVIGGDDLSEGIQIDAPQAIVQIQNVGIYDIHARDQVSFSDNHPDLIQPYGGVAELRVDRFTGSTDYQGLFFKSGVPFHAIHLKRVNIIGLPTARYLLWFGPDAAAGSVFLQDVWVDIPAQRRGGLSKSVWPDVDGTYPAQAQIADVLGTNAAFWPDDMHPGVYGMVLEGRPPGGDYVKRDEIGLHYVSPGYQ